MNTEQHWDILVSGILDCFLNYIGLPDGHLANTSLKYKLHKKIIIYYDFIYLFPDWYKHGKVPMVTYLHISERDIASSPKQNTFFQETTFMTLLCLHSLQI